MKKVLVADDNPVSRELVRELVEPYAEVVEAVDGRDAFVKMRAERPDLVFLDIQMPGLDGFTVLQHWRDSGQLRHGPAVVALTAYAMQGDREKALAAGFDDYITKPIDIPAFRKKLHELLQ
jgi:CheY-like chemotaxis protein